MSYFEPETWRTFSRAEMLADLKRMQAEKAARDEHKSDLMVFQRMISPLDVYCYLKARFGEPNGIQTLIKKDDSDNLFHWDYKLKAGEKSLYIIGATQEIHVFVDESLSDDEWIRFVICLKSDFKNYGKEKSKVKAQLEKWEIFHNQFFLVAEECAELCSEISDSIEMIDNFSADGKRIINDGILNDEIEEYGSSIQTIKSACLKLNILMPVMFESFVGLLIAMLVKPEVRTNKRVYEAFIRSSLDVKIFDLAIRCMWFEKEIQSNNQAMARYWQVVNRRNDIIHGNVDPESGSLGTVYFDKKVPLFPSGGDRIKLYWEGILKIYKPRALLEDYEATHHFIQDIINHLDPKIRHEVRSIIATSEPGWDAKRRKFGRLFPDFIASFTVQGTRYDSELQIDARQAAILGADENSAPSEREAGPDLDLKS